MNPMKDFFKYSMQLYGVSKSIPIINLLIKRFLNTVNDDQIKGMLSKIGWNDSFKQVDKTTYSIFREVCCRFNKIFPKKVLKIAIH